MRPRGRDSSTGWTAGGSVDSGAGGCSVPERVWRGLDTFELRSAFDTFWFSRDPALDGEPKRCGQIDLAVSM
ncbi:hypothetical protein GCM10010282_32470 [Streptomyces roseolus]|nr:hypothetical protein GCM10010282_32470 [Streptomyces roseolus]